MASRKQIETYRGCVLAGESDSNQHMNVAYYLSKFEQAGGQFLSMIGLTQKYLKGQNWGIAVLEYNIKYLQEVFEDQALHILSSVESTTHKVMVVRHEMKDSVTQQTVSEAVGTFVLFDKEQRKSVPLPEIAVGNLTRFLERE